MKKKNLFIAGLFVALLSAALYSFKSPAPLPDKSGQILGTVIASALDYDHLERITGDPNVIDPKISIWVPADGRGIAESELSKQTGMLNAPDLRGRFLRGLNTMYSNGQPSLLINTADEGDPNSNRKAGEYQGDEFRSHTHSVSDNSQPFAFRTSGMGIQANTGQQVQFGKPNISINATGGVETRPKNVSVYYYIKIN